MGSKKELKEAEKTIEEKKPEKIEESKPEPVKDDLKKNQAEALKRLRMKNSKKPFLGKNASNSEIVEAVNFILEKLP